VDEVPALLDEPPVEELPPEAPASLAAITVVAENDEQAGAAAIRMDALIGADGDSLADARLGTANDNSRRARNSTAAAKPAFLTERGFHIG
jgi:hypothetical protein